MRIYIWDYLDEVSNRYHRSGGAAVVANDDAHARELIADEPDFDVTEEEWAEVVRYDLVGEHEPRVFIFPDAGCCG